MQDMDANSKAVSLYSAQEVNERALGFHGKRRYSGTMTRIYKISPKALWREAEVKGQFTGAPVDIADGYIHFSAAHQVKETASRHFKGQRDLVLAFVDADQLSDALKWEASRGGDLFPHLYGPMPMTAVVKVIDLPLDDAGIPIVPELSA